MIVTKFVVSWHETDPWPDQDAASEEFIALPFDMACKSLRNAILWHLDQASEADKDTYQAVLNELPNTPEAVSSCQWWTARHEYKITLEG